MEKMVPAGPGVTGYRMCLMASPVPRSKMWGKAAAKMGRQAGPSSAMPGQGGAPGPVSGGALPGRVSTFFSLASPECVTMGVCARGTPNSSCG